MINKPFKKINFIFRLIPILLSTFIYTSQDAFANSSVLISDSLADYIAEPFLECFVDVTAEKTINQIADPSMERRFKPYDPNSVETRISTSAIWYRFKLDYPTNKNSMAAKDGLILFEVGKAHLEKVDFSYPKPYTFSAYGVNKYEAVQIGTMRPSDQIEIAFPTHVFKLYQTGQGDSSYYFRIQSYSAIIIRPKNSKVF
jgi:hypothetical protein